MTSLELRGVRVHNLKNVDVAIPLGRITLVVGVSGAGKSSLVFDALFAEAQRRYLQSFSIASRQFLEKFDQPDADWIGDLPPAIAVRASDPWPTVAATVADVSDLGELLAELFAAEGISHCGNCGQSVRPNSPEDVAREIEAMPMGTRATLAFPDRPGSGETADAWFDRLKEDGWIRIRTNGVVHRLDAADLPTDVDDALVLVDRFDAGKTPRERILESADLAFRRGDGRIALLADAGERRFDRRWMCPRCDLAVPIPEPRLFDPRDPLAACPTCHGVGEIRNAICPTCDGRRFNDRALAVRWNSRTIADFHAAPIGDLAAMFQVPLPPYSGGEGSPTGVLAERLSLLTSLGLNRLTPGRSLATLGSGEAQRLRLLRGFAAELTDALYLFDEPTAGLHPADLPSIAAWFRRIRAAGNTVVVVDPHPLLPGIADHVIEVGPGAGAEGGEITAFGPPADAALPQPEPTRPRTRSHGELRLSLDSGETVAFPLGVLCVLTGVSGSGKTRVLRDRLIPAVRDRGPDIAIDGGVIDGVALFDSTPLTRSSRSNPATALKIFDDIRQVFAETTDARIRNFDPGAFSFNQPGGRCETCEGQGTLAIDMQFLSDVRTTCPECLGRRYRREILDITVRGLNIAETLELTAREAFRFFRTQRSVEKKLKWLLDVGLDYLRLGQSLDSLSLGEMQRLKLASHLASSRKPRTLFVLIEPTRGLHPDDVRQLVSCFGQMLATGHSIIAEETNPYFWILADWLVELSPGGGVLASGTADDMRSRDTPTGRFLADWLAGSQPRE